MVFLFTKVAIGEGDDSTLVEDVASEDIVWIERLKAGDVRAFDFLVKKYQRRLYSVIYNLTANKEDSADLAQEAFVKAFRSIHSFKGNSAFYTWLYRIALNTTLTFLKKNRKNALLSLENCDEALQRSETFARLAENRGGDKATLLHELQEKLNEALQSLSLKHRTVVILFEIEGMSHSEIAKTLKCSEGTVRSRLHYAKEQLKQALSPYLKSWKNPHENL